MSLRWMDYETEFENLAEASFQKEVEENPDYYDSLSPRTSKIIYHDTRYNIDFLYTAYLLHDDKLWTIMRSGCTSCWRRSSGSRPRNRPAGTSSSILM